MRVVGITGGSASGKTTFTRSLVSGLAAFDPVVLNQDRYFRDWEDLPPERREQERTTNHPRGVLWDTLLEHVRTLRAGGTIRTPVPGTRASRRGEPTVEVGPAHLLIVEGHLVFWEERLRDLMDLKIYIDVEPHERVLRRMLRDTDSGRTSLEGAVAWYRRDVIPNFPVYTAPTRAFADLIVPFEGDGQTAVAVICSGIRDQLGNAEG